MKATIENVINGKNLEDFELNFDWILYKSNHKFYKYELVFTETTFHPELSNIDNITGKETWKKIYNSPMYRKIIDELRNAAEKWFNDHNIYSGKNIQFHGDSPEAIKNDICFSKILPYVDPTKMEVIDLTK